MRRARAGYAAPADRLPDSGRRRPAGPLLFVISGPSGVGKDSLVSELRRRDPSRHYVVTVTTRPRRPGETDGVHYHFRTREEFDRLAQQGEFLETAIVYENAYGTPKFELREALQRGQDVVVKVDIQGAASIRRAVPQAVLIFLAPDSLAELVDRLAQRNTESGADLRVRSEAAYHEMEAISSFDYVVVNADGQLDRAVADVEAIMRAEQLRVAPRVFSLP